MDIAAQYCTARSPRCLLCPTAQACHSAFSLLDVAPPHVVEPSHRGKPNRIWRGRIVELLRSLGPGEAMEFRELMSRLLENEEDGDRPWLEHVLAALERDRIIDRDPHAHTIRLRS
jgi:hypothetical protein